MVMAQSLFRTLRQLHPHCPLDVVAPQWSLPLLARMPEVRAGVVMPIGHGRFALKERYQLGKSLAATGYQKAIVLPNSWKSALVPFFAGIPQRIGYLGELRWGLLTEARPLDKKRLPRTVDRFVALANPANAQPQASLPLPALQANPDMGEKTMERLGLLPDSLILCPGAEYGPAKQWPLHHFRQLAISWQNKGSQVWVLGSEKEAPAGEEISQGLSHVVNLAGRTSLEEAVDLLALSIAVVSNDSGLMHVAAALDKPLVALYGSSDPSFTPPLGQRSAILRLGLPCSPCFKRVCPLGHLDCLEKISPEMVLNRLESLL
ncbi:MAG: lipopolysaccharide heptosyltransferase II [Magnetococcales bacterium]|nr:lipopolysaccharide heptosyltransferase II [Magnetococcales bacterium]NGZ28181.1 lipopolysaccharide heptosyltransferase II [Magnetococcales bacterium]